MQQKSKKSLQQTYNIQSQGSIMEPLFTNAQKLIW